jgi:hypothetical protein
VIPSVPQVLGEAMTGISQNAKNGNLPEFGEAIATASKALCGFTEAAAQVNSLPHLPSHVHKSRSLCFVKPTLWTLEFPPPEGDIHQQLLNTTIPILIAITFEP